MHQTHVNRVRCFLFGIVLAAAAGAAQPAAGDLKLPVPRTFDLTHVEPAHYAVALGKDPARIFEFVRDQIGYDVYTGALRGPRGTLLAMAGNSVDRAALLASLLKESGHRVQFVRGTLPKAEARKLVEAMWAERARPAPSEGGGEPSPALKAASDTFMAGVKRDYALIRDHLKKANMTPSPQSAPSLDALVQEAQEHYWVQWSKDNTWVDLDPSFADATPGRKYAPVAKTYDALLPEALFHRVAIRVRIEEYAILLTGNAEGTPTSRDILSYTAKAADLSGVDLVLSHQPENWKGPATSLQAAISSAITSTGRVKPVLLVGGQNWIAGEAFRQKPPTGAGIGSITDLLGGAGTRKPAPIATAETIELDFIFPGGKKETVVREIFDVVGKARRRAGSSLTADEVRERAGNAPDVTQGIFSLFFATGRVESDHFSDVTQNLSSAEDQNVDIDGVLRGISATFIAASDALLRQLGRSEHATLRFYPDSPRVIISELSGLGGKPPRIALDLRRDHVRVAAIGLSLEDVIAAQIFRGVVEGTLERVLMEYAMTGAPEGLLKPLISTSSLLEQARAIGVPLLLLPDQDARLDRLPDDTLARLREEVSAGYLAVVPRSPIAVAGAPRLAWWRIHPQSGETTAVTDEGLHQVVVEYRVHQDQQSGRTTVTVTRLYPNGGRYFRTTHWNLRDPRLWRRFLRYTRLLDQAMGKGPFLH